MKFILSILYIPLILLGIILGFSIKENNLLDYSDFTIHHSKRLIFVLFYEELLTMAVLTVILTVILIMLNSNIVWFLIIFSLFIIISLIGLKVAYDRFSIKGDTFTIKKLFQKRITGNINELKYEIMNSSIHRRGKIIKVMCNGKKVFTIDNDFCGYNFFLEYINIAN